MEQNKNNFETTAANAEEKLGRVSNAMDSAMARFPEERYEEFAEKLAESKAAEIISLYEEKGSDWDSIKFADRAIKMILTFTPVLSEVPRCLTKPIIDKILNNKEFFRFLHEGSIAFGTALSVMLQILGSKKEKDTIDVPIEIEADGDSMNVLPSYLGAFLPANIRLIFSGDTEIRAGYLLMGGELVIEGDVADRAGEAMESGSLTIFGNADEKIGAHMIGGMLTITGEVSSFYFSAFSDSNHGTIIWKGITLWNDGWTKEGLEMKKAGKIPGIYHD